MIADSTASKHFYCFLRSKLDILTELRLLEEITKVAKSHKFMDFTTNVSESMDQLMCGDIAQRYLTIFPLQRLSMTKLFVFTEVYPQA